jgi:hypothetical protein
MPGALATAITFRPVTRPVTSPMKLPGSADGRKAAVTSRPAVDTLSPFAAEAGTLTLTSTLPPVTRCGSVDSAVMETGTGGRLCAAADAITTTMPPSARNRGIIGQLP